MFQTLDQDSFCEAVKSCASRKRILLAGGDSRFVALQYRRSPVGEPMEIVDMWEAPEPMPFCPVGFAEAEVDPGSKDAETLSILWQFARTGH